MTKQKIPTPEEFSLEVENRCWTDKDEYSYLFHTTKLIEELGLEPEEGAKLISPSLLDKIKNEAIDNRQLKEKHTTCSVFGF